MPSDHEDTPSRADADADNKEESSSDSSDQDDNFQAAGTPD